MMKENELRIMRSEDGDTHSGSGEANSLQVSGKETQLLQILQVHALLPKSEPEHE